MHRTRQGPALRRGAIFLLCALSILAALPAVAAEKKPAKKPAQKPAAELEWTGVSPKVYSACIDKAQRQPEAGFEQAIAWRDMGGGAPAKHCVAVALFALGNYVDAAIRLEQLATDGRTLPTKLRTALLGQAGEAWLSAQDYGRAYGTLSAALKITPDDTGLLLARSLAAAGAQSYFDAIDDLNRVIELQPDDAEALTYRATAYRYLDSLELAADDVERALKAMPEDTGALLERGNLRRIKGDAAGARKDWLKVIALAPESEVAEAARHNIEALDIKTP